MVARLVTACGVAVEEVAFFNDSEPGTHLAFGQMDDPDFWYEDSVTCLSLGADRVMSDFTPDDDHWSWTHGWSGCGAFVENGLRLQRCM